MPLKHAVKEGRLTPAHVEALRKVWLQGKISVAFYLGEPAIPQQARCDATSMHKLLAELANEGYLHRAPGNPTVFTIPESKAVEMSAALKEYFAKTCVSRRKFYAAGTRRTRVKRA